MPELPDVEVFRGYLEAHVLKKRVDALEVAEPRIVEGLTVRTLRQRLQGRRLEGTARRGKHLFVRTDGDGSLVLHFGMTGYPEVVEDGDGLPEHTRATLLLEDGSSLAYACMRMLGKVSWTQSIEKYVAAEELGPDALGIDLGRLKAALSHSRAGLKSALMDQSRLAGLGNVYTDEVLYQAQLPPELPARELDERSLKRLHRTMQRVLKVTIRHGARPGELPRRYLLPHRQEGRPCPRCGTPIEKRTVAGRRAYVCPRCQQTP